MVDTLPDEKSPEESIRPSRHSMTPLVLGAIVAILLLAADGALTLYNARRLHRENSKITHTQQVTVGLERILSHMKDAENGQRGFLLTGEEPYLQPYRNSVAQVSSQVDAVQKLTVDNPAQQARFPELRALIDTRLGLLEENIATRRAGSLDTSAAMMKEGTGKLTMDAIRLVIDEMLDDESSLLQKRETRSQATYNAVLGSGTLSSVAAICAILALLIATRRHLAGREVSESKLAEQGERLRTTLASIGDAVITTDKDGRVTHLNPVARELTRWTNEQATGKPLHEVFRIVNETTRKTVESPVAKALREGVIVGLANHTILIAKDGVEWGIDDSAAPIRCADGEIVGCVLVFRDITERRAAERELQTSEARKSAILASSLDAIIGMDHEGVIGDWNSAAERIFGFSRNEALGHQVADLIIPEEFRDDHRRGLERFLATGEGPVLGRRLELVARRSNGDRFPCELTITTTMVEGSPPYFTAYLRDITDRKQAEQVLSERTDELVQADRSKDEFLAMLAHELRNPLAPMRTAAEILRFPHAGRLERSYAQDILERQIGNMTRMIDDLLDVSRITQGKIDLRLQSVDLAEIVNSAVEMARPGLAGQDQTLAVNLPREPIMLSADATRLEQVFNNLLGNACKYSGRGSHISLAAKVEEGKDGREAVIRVADNGTGIDAELLPRVFDIFVQSSRALDRSHGGLGIGLTLVQRLVKLHGGSVEAHSAGLGHGTEFVLRLPVLPSTASASSNPGPAPAAGRVLRMLIVDDNRDSAESLAMLQQMSGHETRTAHDGVHALAAAAEFQPDVVLLDIGLPGMDGFEIARRLREIPGLEKTFIAAMTGYGSEEDRQRTREAGFNEHLVKPVDPKLLQTLLKNLS